MYDFLIIGAGLVGCGIARELARRPLRIAVVEKKYDVGDGVSKGNSSLLHSGYDTKPGSLEARLCVEGYRLWREQADELGVPVAPLGAVMVALDQEQYNSLDTYYSNAHQNGVTDVQRLTRDEVLARVPVVNSSALGGLWIPREGITCTFTATTALAEHAAVNGVEFKLGERVTAIQKSDALYRITTTRAQYETRWIVNSAGLWGDEIAALTGEPSFKITPRKGEFLILDKSARAQVPHILLPVPTRITKGILVAPTIYGNVLLGPTADDIQDKTDSGVTADGLNRARTGALKLAPALADEPVIATYAGLRPASGQSDYIIEVDHQTHQVVAAGIRSTGLTAALAIGCEIARRLESGGALPERKPTLVPRPRRAWIPGSPRPCLDPTRLKQNPTFGRILCQCETVSEGEVTEALHTPIPATTLDAVKRRTWATAGRCQGFYCTAAILEVMARELGTPLNAITKRGPGSEIVP